MEPLLPADDGPAPLDARLAPGGTHELWLMRVPRHSVLRKSLVGKEIQLGDPAAPNQVRGNYRFSDAGLSRAARALRPVLVAPGDGEGGKGGDGGEGGRRYVLGPRFVRQVDVTFTGSEMLPLKKARAPRTYPLPPDQGELRVKYRPIGWDGAVGVGGARTAAAAASAGGGGDVSLPNQDGSAGKAAGESSGTQSAGAATGGNSKSLGRRRSKKEGGRRVDKIAKKRKKSGGDCKKL